jgi:hypothetical protein
MRYPNPFRPRRQIDALTGIKSSLDHIRSVIALVYLLYIANERKSYVRYSVSDGSQIKIDPTILESIEKMLGKSDIESIINNNPLLTKQYEPLYVGITLLMKLGHLKIEGKQSTAERTGGIRYPKQLYFANNTIILDLILSGIPEDVRYTSLFEWLQNKKASNSVFEDRVCMFLTTCTIFTQFKLRDNTNKELFFQTEGIYSAIKESDDDVLYADSHEFVGPTRIYNNILGEGLEPWISVKRGLLGFRDRRNPNAESMSDMISTTLNIFNVKNDAVVMDNDYVEDNLEETQDNSLNNNPLQQIYFGTPGSGKSWTIKQKYEQDETKVFRTTFHPDTDYASFVGCYKPVKDEDDDNKIVYEFVPQAFTDAYVAAWNDLDNPYYLIIEEINRGNCAQIFGDLFQLLDRNKNGYSEYPIKADHDLRDYLVEHLPEGSEGIKDGKLCLPPNLSIIASMNTSDQSLFPMDSAFKRRWSWEYVPIDYENAESGSFMMTIGGESYNWHDFLKAANKKIKKVTSSEDKQMGNFFIKSSIDEKEFCDKVMFYLWSEVGKDNYQTNDAIFKYYAEEDKPKEFSFNELYDQEKRTTILKGFIRYIEEEEK